MFNLHIQNHLVPEFSTYNIAHHYTLDIKPRLECDGEDMNCDLEDQPIEIMPPPAATSAATYHNTPAQTHYQPYQAADTTTYGAGYQ
jgi:hypothetical protein